MKTSTRFAGLVIMALAFLLVAGQRQAAAQSGGTLERVKQTKVLRDCVDPEYPPDVFKDKDGKFAGFGIELAAQMAKALGAEVQYVETNWDGIIPSLLANKCDIAMTSMTPRPARALVVTFAKVYYPETMALLVKAGDTRTTPEDFNKPDVKLCIQQGTLDEVIWKKFFPQAQGTLLQSQTDCFLQVASGKVDGAPSDYPTTMAFTKAHPTQIKPVLSGLLGSVSAAPAIQHNDLEFRVWVDEFFADMINSGDYAALYRKIVGYDVDIPHLMLERGNM